MKKYWLILIFCIMLSVQNVYANEVTEDYIDITTGYVVDGNYSEAMKYINKALYISPNDKKILEMKYCIEGILNPYFKSNFSSKNTSSLNNPNDYSYSDISFAKKALNLYNLNQYNEALNAINSALSISNNAEYQLIKAKILYQKGYYLEAKEILEKLSTTYQTAEIFEYIGLAEYKLKNYANSLLNLDKAIILSDDDKNLNLKYNEVRLLLENNQK